MLSTCGSQLHADDLPGRIGILQAAVQVDVEELGTAMSPTATNHLVIITIISINYYGGVLIKQF